MDIETIEMIKKGTEPFIGKPVAIRHHMSGVWLGIFLGLSPFSPSMFLIRGRRVWSWSGSRLEFSELCHKGVSSGDRLGMITEQSIPYMPGDGLVEMTTQVDQKVIDDAFKL